jgi:hypothetical protein
VISGKLTPHLCKDVNNNRGIRSEALSKTFADLGFADKGKIFGCPAL